MSMFDFLRKAAPVRNPADVPKNPISVWNGIPRSFISYESIVSAEAALQHPIVYRMLNKLATSVQSVKFIAVADKSVNVKAKPSDAALQRVQDLLDSPNDSMTQSQFLYWATINFACYGRIPFKIGTGVEKHANGIYPLEARFVFANVDDRGQIDGYKYGISDGQVSQTLPTRKRAEKNGTTEKGWVSEIYTPNLAGNHNTSHTHGASLSPLAAIGLPVQVTRLLLQRAADTASGAPNTKYIVSGDKTVTKSQEKAIRNHMEEAAPGGETASDVLFLFNTTVKVDELKNDLSDIHSKMPLDDFTKIIAGSFGIPVPLLGLTSADAAKFSGNYAEARQSFWEDTLIPSYLEPMAQGLTQAICPPGILVKADLDSVQAIIAIRAARAAALSAITFLTNDEKRELVDYEKLTNEQAVQLDKEQNPIKVAKPGEGK